MGDAPLKNPRHEAFCLEVIRQKNNATAAYIAAGYSERGAAQSACALLRNPDVKARIDNLRQSGFRALHMSADETLAEIAKVARFSMGSILHLTPDGDPYIDLNKASDEDMAALSEVTIEDFTDGREVDEQGETVVRQVRRVKAKAHSKIGALTLIAKAHGLLIEKHEVSVDGDFATKMAAAFARSSKGDGNGTE